MNKISQLVIFYFSGTGNAKQIALWLLQFAAQKKIDCRIFNIAKTNQTDIESFSPDALIVIISPIHGFNYPKITTNFILQFPKGKNRIVLMNTRAGMRLGRLVTPGLTGVAFFLSSFILKRKGYKITGQIPFDMPSNWISIHPALKEKTVKFLHERNYKRVQKYAPVIFSGETKFASRKDIIQDILISPVALAYFLVGRFAIAKSFYASPKCNHCGNCIKQCPVHAIKEFKGHPYWTFKCESCMKCMNTCPKKAIETAHGLFALLLLLVIPVITYLLYSVMAVNIQSGFIRFLVFNGIFFFMLWVFYGFQHFMLPSKWVGKLISFTSLTHYKFWGRYKSIPDRMWKKKTSA